MSRAPRARLVAVIAALVAALGLAAAYLAVERREPTSTAEPATAEAEAPAVPSSAPGSAVPDAADDDLAAIVKSDEASKEDRLAAVHDLAERGDVDALTGLASLLASHTDLDVRMALASELMRLTDDPAALLRELLGRGLDFFVLRAAVQGLAQSDHPEAVPLLEALLRDTAVTGALRLEAALGLGSIGSQAAYDALTAAYASAADEDGVSHALEGLALFPLEQTEGLFREALKSENVTIFNKLDLLESLADNPADPTALLLDVAATAPDPMLRATAIETIGLRDDAPAAKPKLVEMLAHESEPQVRAKIYNALAFDVASTAPHLDMAAFGETVLQEQAVKARVEGFRLAAELSHLDQTGALIGLFETNMLPWLVTAASSQTDLYIRLVAVDALGQFGTESAQRALEALAGTSGNPTIAQAAQSALSVARAR